MPQFFTRKFIVGSCTMLLLAGAVGFFLYGLTPIGARADAAPAIFEIKQGEGFHEIITGLAHAGIVRSSFATEALSLLNGSAFHLQPGLYRLNATMSPWAVLGELSKNAAGETTITIPEGANLYQIDAILAKALVIRRGDLVNFHDAGNLEGKLFPDTYRFYTNSPIGDVVKAMLDNFDAKAAPIMAQDGADAPNDLILASILEKEVSNSDDRRIVAGILWKRLRAGMPLQVDATVCYAMQIGTPLSEPGCGTIDLKIDSPYNTYLYKGLPPGPIGNPGISAIQAALTPTSSPYWFYLSDPKTGKTIFAKTLDEQHQNTVKYLVR
jgi:UPF0755 protein